MEFFMLFNISVARSDEQKSLSMVQIQIQGAPVLKLAPSWKAN